MTKRFFVEETDCVELSLRRHSGPWCEREACPHPDNDGYHQAQVSIGVYPARLTVDYMRDVETSTLVPWPVKELADDSRWPTHCKCGAAFTKKDTWQVSQDRIYRRTDTGEECGLRIWQKTPGAIIRKPPTTP